jgi:caspase domain-containing protein/subtilase family protein
MAVSHTTESLFGVLKLLALAVTVLTCSSAWPAEQSKRALLIGIDRYQSPEIRPLQGAVNDIMLMRTILIGKFDVPDDHIMLLTNEQATHQGIVDAIRNHLGKAKPGDVAILYFSGHGSQIKDDSDDEIDGLDETLVTYDDRTEGHYGITDDEINGLMAELSKKTKNITLIFDSCHSGAAARAGNTVRQIAADTRTPPPPPAYAISARGAEGSSDVRADGADYVLISGSLANELSNEGLFEGKRRGALSWFLAQALTAASARTTYRAVMDEVRTEVNQRYPSQSPQIEGPGQDRVFFGTDKIEVRPYVLAKPLADKLVEIQAGTVFGLQRDTLLKVFPPKTLDFTTLPPIATVKVTTAQDFRSEATILDGGPILPQSRALFEATMLGETSIPVYVAASTSPQLGRIKERIATMPAIAFVDDQQSARLLITQKDGKIAVASGDLEVLVPPVSVPMAGAEEHVADQVKSLVHWLMILNLRNPTSGIQLDFEVRRERDPLGTPIPDEVSHGTTLTYVVRNKDVDPLFIYVLDVGSNGEIVLLHPRTKGQNEQLPPGAKIERPIKMTAPVGQTGMVDVLKVIATTKTIDPSIFPQGAIREAPAFTARGNPLERFLANVLRGTKTAENVDVKTWGTAQVAIRVRRAGARLSSFSLHFDGPQDAQSIQDKLTGTKEVCAPADTNPGKRCERLAPIGTDQSTFEMTAYSTKRGDADIVSVGQAFDEAYDLQDHTGALRVEPMFEMQVPGVETNRGIDKRDISGDEQHDPLAEADDQWHLKQVRAIEAWGKIRSRYGRDEGDEAQGIYIAHVDTGYTKHPEIWHEANGRKVIDVAKGHNYYEGNSNAEDPLLSDQLLDNPGHGTASSSVIVSPAGCQLQGRSGCVSGVGRGAQVIPLRVHRSVSQLHLSYMARAIRDVADSQISGDPQLVSIAMGGPPTIALWKAVQHAENKGVLVVAAAGNNIGSVVWPARFKSTIAAAAVNVRCRPWKGSSHGHAVDISAPGESVWRATLNEKHDYINAMGKGTTFATGTTSGTAALWLAWHRDDPILQQLRDQGLVARVFRDALRASAWKPSADPTLNPPETHCDASTWDTNGYGPGIVNTSALLEVPLHVPAARALPAAGLAKIPLFASLYPESADPVKIKADYELLLGTKKNTSSDDLTKFETEILYHYTTNDEIARAIDMVVEGQRALDGGDTVRRALLRQDLSQRLRLLLTQ